jgi:hypothetical protein
MTHGNRSILGGAILAMLIVFGLLQPAPIRAQYAIARSSLGMTGGEAESASYRLFATCGQTAAEISSSAQYVLTSGFLAFGLGAVGIGGPTEGDPLPRSFALTQNYPNPFNPQTTIRLDIPGYAGTNVQVRLDIFTIRGRLVKTLIDGRREPGSYLVHWDGRTDSGEHAGSGVYLYRINAGEFTATRKMVMAR